MQRLLAQGLAGAMRSDKRNFEPRKPGRGGIGIHVVPYGYEEDEGYGIQYGLASRGKENCDLPEPLETWHEAQVVPGRQPGHLGPEYQRVAPHRRGDPPPIKYRAPYVGAPLRYDRKFTIAIERNSIQATLNRELQHQGTFCLSKYTSMGGLQTRPYVMDDLCDLCKKLAGPRGLSEDTHFMMHEHMDVFKAHWDWPKMVMPDGTHPRLFIEFDYGSAMYEDGTTYTGAAHCHNFYYKRCFYDKNRERCYWCAKCVYYDQALWHLQPLELLYWMDRTGQPLLFARHLKARAKQLYLLQQGRIVRLKR
jgi:hypothetical protein